MRRLLFLVKPTLFLLYLSASWVGSSQGQSLTIQTSVSPNPARSGERVTYEITVANHDDEAFADVTVQFLVPSGVNATTGLVASVGATCPGGSCQAGELVTWSLGMLPVNRFRTVSLSIPVLTGVGTPPDGTSIDLIASAFDVGGATTTRSRSVVVQSDPKIRVYLEEDKDPVGPGEILTYTLVYSNPSTTSAPNAALSFEIPGNTEFLSASDGGALNAGTVDWAIGTLTAGEVGRRQVKVLITAEEGDLIAGQANLIAGPASEFVSRAEKTTSVSPGNPLKLSMIANPDPVGLGERITYEMTVANQGDTSLSGVGVRFQVPDFVNATTGLLASDGATCPGGSCQSGEFVSWTIGSIPAGQTRSVRLSMPTLGTLAEGTAIESFASVFEDSGAQSTQSRTVLVQAEPKTRVYLEEDADPVEPGGILTYTLIYANPSTISAPNATLHFAIPEGTDFVTADEEGTSDGEGVEWTVGTLTAGEVGRRHVEVQVTAEEGALIRADAELRDTADPQGISRAAKITTVRGENPLRLRMASAPDPVRPGERITYQMTISNQGDSELNGVGVRFQVPEFVNATTGLLASEGATCPGGSCQSGEFVSWTLGTLPIGLSETVSLSVPVLAGTADGTPIEAYALAFDGEGAMSSESRTVLVQSDPKVRVFLEEDLDPIATGETLTYTLIYANRSSASAPNATLSFTLPVGTTFLSAEKGAIVSGATVEWPLGTLTAGEVGRRQVKVTVVEVDGALIVGNAALHDSADPRAISRADTVTTVRTDNPLRLRLSANPDPIRPGERITYTMRVSNQGDSELNGVGVRFQVPEFVNATTGLLASEGATCSGGSCQSGEFVSWTLGTIPVGQSQSVNLSVPVLSDPPDGAVIEAFALAFDGEGAMTLEQRTVLVQDDPKVQVFLEEDLDPVETGGILTYTLTYRNPSAISAPDATLRFVVPDGTVLLDADGGGNLTGDIVEWPLGTLTTGEYGRRQVTVMVSAEDAAILYGKAEIHDSADPQGISRADTLTSVRTGAPLQLRMSSGPDPVQPGERVVFEMTVSNQGDSDLSGVGIRFQVPEFVNATTGLTSSPGATCPGGSCQSGEHVSWVLGTLPVGQSRTVSTSIPLLADTNENVIVGHSWAVYEGGGAITAQSQVVVAQEDPRLLLYLDEDRDPVEPGAALTYTISFGNPSVTSAPDAELRFKIPAGTVFVSADKGAILIGDTVVWRWGALPAGKVADRHVTVMAPDVEGALIAAEAFLSDSSDPQASARATEITSVESDNALGLTLTGAPDPAMPGDLLYYELNATNEGAFDLSGVVARLRVPEFVNSTTGLIANPAGICPGGSCQSGEFLTWDLGTLAVAESRILRATMPIFANQFAPPDGTLIRAIAEAESGASEFSAVASATIKVGTLTPDIPARVNYDLCPPPSGDGILDACDLLLILEDMRSGGLPEIELFGVSRDWLEEGIF